jgi:RNA polymerase sigma-70 factor, ECF subfamily
MHSSRRRQDFWSFSQKNPEPKKMSDPARDEDPGDPLRTRTGAGTEARGEIAQTNTDESTSFREILDAARSGNRKALGTLLERHRPYLLRALRSRIEKGWIADVGGSDLVQDTFLNAQIRLGQFRGETDSELRAWLRTTIERKLMDVARGDRTGTPRSGRRFPIDFAGRPAADASQRIDPRSGPLEAVLRLEEDETVRAAIGDLPADDRRILFWHALEMLTFREIGRRLGCSTAAAHRRWLATLESLGGKLRRLGI